MACFEDQVRRRLRIDPIIAKSFYNRAKEGLVAGKDPVAVIQEMAKDSGLQPSTVGHILNADKRMFAFTRQAMLDRAKVTELKRAAGDFVRQADTPVWRKGVQYAWDSTRRLATMFHGGVFPFTHARNLPGQGAFEAKVFGQMGARAYSYMTPKAGKARWIRDMNEMQLRPSYKAALQLGLDIKPGEAPVGILASGAKGWGQRGFDAIKPGRLDLWDRYMESVPEEFRDELSGRQLAYQINRMTGSITHVDPRIQKAAGATMFAPKLWFAKRLQALQPILHMAKAGKMTPGERAASNLALRKWAKIVGVQVGLLAANDAYNKYVAKDDNRVNWTDFTKPGTLWRGRVGNLVIPIFPMMEVIRTPVAALAALFMSKQQLRGDAPMSRSAEILARDLMNAVHPSISTAVEQISGREVFGVPGHLRRLPYKGVAQMVRGEEKEKDPAITKLEYALSKSLIPISAASRVFSQALQEEGVSPTDSQAWVKAIVSGALSGVFGLHAHEHHELKGGRQKTRSSLSDLKRERIRESLSR